jgi:predicted dehydrogenase
VTVGVAIVGCGLIGKKRLLALPASHRLVVAVDAVRERAEALVKMAPGAVAETDYASAVCRPEVGLVIVATTNEWLAPVTLAAVQAGKPVLVEKPAARRPEELVPVIAAARAHGICVRVGFNHRFHPAFQRARTLFNEGVLGPMMFLRARYGHGGRIGYDKEWRAEPERAGGGELLDQGVHLIDLSRWFLGDFSRVSGSVHTYFWQMPVEDNGFLHLETPGGQVAWLHATCTEWKNTFSFELYGRNAKLQVDGLGGSYGTERLTYYKMLPEMGPPDTTIWEYPGEDRSWRHEFEALLAALDGRRADIGTLEDAKAALEVVHRVYEQSKGMAS